MTISEEVSAELDRLDVEGWQRALALRLAATVDEAGTASAASLLRTLMIEMAGTDTPDDGFIAGLRAKVQRQQQSLRGERPQAGLNARREAKTNKTIRSLIKTEPAAATKSGARLCADCGVELPAPTGRGRPRVRCEGGCQK